MRNNLNFKPITILDRNKIESITKDFPPYCDFNFSNIYNWSSKKEQTYYFIYKRNLIIKMVDFTSEKEIISIIGKNDINTTIRFLINIYKGLEMVPEMTIKYIDRKKFKDIRIKEDRNNRDYILSLNKITKLKGEGYKTKRRWINKFLSENPNPKVKTINLQNTKTKKQINNLFNRWAIGKGKTKKEVSREYKALNRLIDTSHMYNMANIGVYDKNTLIAFTTNELKKNDIAIVGFGKADDNYKGLSQYLEYITAKELIKLGYKYLNYEQDLGLIGLRKYKLSWQPVKFLKKYLIYKI